MRETFQSFPTPFHIGINQNWKAKHKLPASPEDIGGHTGQAFHSCPLRTKSKSWSCAWAVPAFFASRSRSIMFFISWNCCLLVVIVLFASFIRADCRLIAILEQQNQEFLQVGLLLFSLHSKWLKHVVAICRRLFPHCLSNTEWNYLQLVGLHAAKYNEHIRHVGTSLAIW